MAMQRRELTGDLDQLLAALDAAISRSVTAKLEAGSEHQLGDARMVVRTYERYSASGGNRLSLTLSVLAVGDRLSLSVVTAGGSRAMFVKINNLGEETFLNRAMVAIDAFAAAEQST